MGKSALLCTAVLIPLCCGSAWAQTAPPAQQTVAGSASAVPVYKIEPPNRLVGYSAWDDDFLYLAIQVNKPTIHGSNSAPFSDPLADDAVIITLQTDNDHTIAHPAAHTVIVAVSSAGGAQLYSGPQKTPLFNGFKDFQNQLQDILLKEQDPAKRDARRTELLGHLLKFQVTPHGRRRESGTDMPGYTAEIAIPWTDLGGKPLAGAHMGFNVTAQSTIPDSPPLQSLSPQVRTPDDVYDPSHWGEIVFSDTAAPSRNGHIICLRVFSNRPVIDGILNDGEWNSLTAYSIEPSGDGDATGGTATQQARILPKFTPQPPRPVVPLPTPSTEPALAPMMAQPLPPMVIARYDYSYQADPRKAAPPTDVIRGDGSSMLSHHPLEGIGPWFSYDRAEWHRQQLLDVRQAGIDVILPVFRGANQDRRRYADKGLEVLTTALMSLRDEQQDYPQVGLYLDLHDLIGENSAATVSPAQLYGMIRDFYRHIPAPFRFTVPISSGRGGTACPIFLSGADALIGMDAGFVDTLRSRFAQEFDGSDLLVIGTADFMSKVKLDGYFAQTDEKGFQLLDGGWIKIASVGPGYDPITTETGGTAAYRPRRNGAAYRADWMAAISRQPNWILLDGWNDYSAASEIAPTFEGGYSTSDITREYSHAWMTTAHRGVKLIGHNGPRRMVSGRTYQVEVRVQNTGSAFWASPPESPVPVEFVYHWLRDGRMVGSGNGTTIEGTVLPGQNVSYTLQIHASDGNGSPLSPGAYDLEIDVEPASKDRRASTTIRTVKAPSGKHAAEAATPVGGVLLQTPIAVLGADAEAPRAATLVRTDLPTMLETGSVYSIRATLRNDGSRPWNKADGSRVTLRLYRTEPGKEAGALIETPVETADATALLDHDVMPGETTEVRLDLPITDPAGSPLPSWSQDDSWTYTARWEITDDHGIGTVIAPMPVAVTNFDFGPYFLLGNSPTSLPAERRLPVRVNLRNDGPRTWVRNSVRVGYHWYYQDGTEFTFDDETTPITTDVPPHGTTGEMLAWVTAPPNDGTYFLVWDLKVGDTWASTTESTHAFDEIVQPVKVFGGRLSFANLTTAFNLDGITDDDTLSNGDFDGRGRTLPASETPPYALGEVIPDGIWLPGAGSGPDSPRRISFRWGPKDPKDKNLITCLGQRIELGKSAAKCRKLHLLAASVNRDVVTNLKLIFEEPTGQSEDLYAFSADRWDQPTAHPNQIGFLAHRHNDRKGAEPGAVALYHYTLTITEPRKLVAIELPDEPSIRIAAITLEK